MVDAQALHAKVKDDIQHFRGYVHNRIPIINTGSKSNLALDRLIVVPLKHYSICPPHIPGIKLVGLAKLIY
jgi:hypothetical protein